ncbi:hypothetical protein [Paraburkholderia sp.]|uniref:hypothetical protein n=1 Tax=Paraburkholderia sp. TaxID=1926495 RepID=UPI002AFF89AA|nr:hypothetical protein [Paraburkholderia sp.]
MTERCFIGKACPWEIQETLQLASEVGALTETNLLEYCRNSLGVDCGGFLANYWGESCPHMIDVAPTGSNGILPRGFWSNDKLWPDVMSRRRQNAENVSPGDAAIFFKDVKDNNPDIAKQRAGGKLIEGTGSEAFHIGVVNNAGFSGKQLLADSGSASRAWGLRVRSGNRFLRRGGACHDVRR